MGTRRGSATTRLAAALRAGLALVLAAGLVPVLGATEADADTTDSAWEAYAALVESGILEAYPDCVFGSISITSDDADDDGVIELEAGQSAIIVIYPYQHVQYEGCRMYSGSVVCPEACGDKTDECWTEYGCRCSTTPTLVTATVEADSDDASVATASQAEATSSLSASRSTLGQKSSAEVTITAVSAGETEVTVSADGIYFWYSCTQTYTVKVTGGDETVYSTSNVVWSWSDDGTTATARYVDEDASVDIELDVEMSTGEATNTCTEAGVVVYIATATLPDGQTATSTSQVTAAATGHDYVATWSWADDGSSASVTLLCSRCDAVVVCEGAIESEEVDGGVRYVASATYEGVEYTSTLTVYESHTHTWGEPAWTWADDGSSAAATFTCSVCGQTTDVEASVDVVQTPAGCTEDAYSVCTASVELDGETYTDIVTVVDEGSATGHSWGEPSWTWADDGTSASAVFTCSACGESLAIEVAANVEETAATCTEDAYRVCTASVELSGTAYSDTVTLVDEGSATGHSWGEPSWTWADDGTSAVATFTCSACGEAATIAASVDVEKTAATCTEDAYRVCTASVELSGAAFSDTVTIVDEGSATGHSWGEPSWTWADDGVSAVATFTCTVCGQTSDVEASVEEEWTSDGVVSTATAALDGATCTDSFTSAYTLTRIGGTNRYETAALEACEAYEQADVVVAATGAGFADALAATSLAGALDAPIVLIDPKGTNNGYAFDAIESLGASRVIVVGGTSAVSASAQTALAALAGVASVERIAGENRYATAEEIYTYGLTAGADGGSVWGEAVVVASGADFADALSVSSLAYAHAYPILLARADGTLSETTSAYLMTAAARGTLDEAVIVGGTAAVGEAAAEELAGYFGEADVVRLGGANRYETSALIASYAAENGLLTWDGAAASSGANFPDALAGAALAGVRGSVVLLVADGRTSYAASALASAAGSVKALTVLGGTSAVSDDAAQTLASALGWTSFETLLVDGSE